MLKHTVNIAVGIKYEKFIFDSWCMVHPKKFGLMQVSKEEQYLI